MDYNKIFGKCDVDLKSSSIYSSINGFYSQKFLLMVLFYALSMKWVAIDTVLKKVGRYIDTVFKKVGRRSQCLKVLEPPI